jgi:hypothetical protein
MVSRRKSLLDVGMWFRNTPSSLQPMLFIAAILLLFYCQREILHAPFQEFQNKVQ